MKTQVITQKKLRDGIVEIINLIIVLIMILNPNKETKGNWQLVINNPSVSINMPINVNIPINIKHISIKY